MKTLPIKIRDKIAVYNSAEKVVCYNSDYLLEFDFDAEWIEYKYKTAIIRYFKAPEGWLKHEIVFEGETCELPVIDKAAELYVGVFAGDIRTTTEAEIPCRPSVLSFDGAPVNPPDDVYNQIMQKLNELEQNGASPEQIAAAVEQYLTENPVTGEKGEPGEKGDPGDKGDPGEKGEPGADGFSPIAKVQQLADGAKIIITDATGTTEASVYNGKDGADGAPGKDGADGQPGADGVGIQSVEQTTTSAEDGGTNVVTVTKADGTTSTFSIKNGSKGSTGHAGADGHTPIKGTDYWTAADKQDIVNDVLAALPIWEGGSY